MSEDRSRHAAHDRASRGPHATIAALAALAAGACSTPRDATPVVDPGPVADPTAESRPRANLSATAPGVDAVVVRTTRASMAERGSIAGLTRDVRPAVEPAAAAELAVVRLPPGAPDVARRGAGDFLGATAAVPPTPAPTFAFNTGTATDTRINVGGSPADANVAASHTHVCVTARAAFACYAKSGRLVSLGDGFDARPYRADDFFEASGISTITSVGGDSNTTKDARVVFDPVRQRFFLVVQSREATARLLIAVSRSEDPRDGWFTYADVVGSAGERAHDYQFVGVNRNHLLVSNIMIDQWSGGSSTRTLHLMYTADDLVNGQPYTRGEWAHVDANRAVPCVHQTSTTDAFWVHRSGDTSVTVWAVRNGTVTRESVSVQDSSAAVDGLQRNENVLLQWTPVVFTNISRAPQNADFRSGRITFVSNDGHTWSGRSSPSNAVRVVRLNVASYFSGTVTVERDRIFGRASADDPDGVVFHYGWPAVATNSAGDAVIGSVRTNSTIYPQIRASVWFADQPDVSSSVLVRSGLGPLGDNGGGSYHMAGAAADPSTDGVYIAQQWPTGGSPAWRIHVAKILGDNRPDLIATAVTAPASAAAGGGSFTVGVTVTNDGDDLMVASQAELWMSSNNVISTSDVLLARYNVPRLLSGQSTTVNVMVSIPAGTPAGTRFIGPWLDRTGVANEYSETNNVNPFRDHDRGNVPINVL